MEDYKKVSRRDIMFYRKEVSKEISKLNGDENSLRSFLNLLREDVVEYRDFLDLVSYGLKSNLMFNFLEKYLEKEYLSCENFEPSIFVSYLDALLNDKRNATAINLVRSDYKNLDSEWDRLVVLELLCDFELWELAEELLSTLTWSGTASKTKFVKIKNRISLSSSYNFNSNCAVVYINLDVDKNKKLALERELAEKFESYYRVPGVLAKNLPDYALSLINRSVTLKKQLGALGCFLGHINAIEKVVDLDLPYALILEDDAFFYYQPSAYAFGKIMSNNFDVLYVNDKMMQQGYSLKNPFGSVSISERLKSFPDRVLGWGAYGYIITNAGAKKLLRNLSQDRMLGHYDGQLGSYGLLGLNFMPESKAQRLALGFTKKFSKNSTPLDIKCLNFPLVSYRDFGVSSRINFS